MSGRDAVSSRRAIDASSGGLATHANDGAVRPQPLSACAVVIEVRDGWAVLNRRHE